MANKELSSQITDRIVTVDQLLNAHDISLEYWEIEKQIVTLGRLEPKHQMV